MTHPWEIEDFLEARDNRLHIDGVDVTRLAEKFGTPLFIFSERRLRHNIERLQRAEHGICCPIKIFYAAKAMSTMGVLQTVRETGIDIEVNSGGELWKARKAGFKPQQIIYNGTSKEVWEIEAAVKAGIFAIQVDSISELAMIESVARRLKKKASVSLRLVPEIESATHSGLQTALLTSKFGMMPDEAFQAFRDYKSSPHIDLAGLHLHIGSQNPDPEAYALAFEKLFVCLAFIYGDCGVKVRHLNLGGGFPVNYLRDRSHAAKVEPNQRAMFKADFEPEHAIVNAWKVLEEIVELSSLNKELIKDVTLLLEPGRSIIADAGVCLTTVRHTKSRPGSKTGKSKSKKADQWLLTDAGFNILLSMETYKWYYHLISATRADDAHKTPYKVAGPLCDGGDVYFDIEGEGRLPDHRLLPASVEAGEVLALLNCGAYSLAQASQYNGRFLPAVVMISGGKPRLIRKRDTFADLVANDIY